MSIVVLAAVAAQFVGSPPVLSTTPMGGSRALTEYLTLTVSPTGQIVGCEARLSTGAPVDDRENCGRLRRAAMQPARDDAGRPVFGLVTVMQQWGSDRSGAAPADLYLKLARLPGGVNAQATSALTVVVGFDGKPESCTVARTSGSDALDRIACRGVSENGLTAAASDSGRLSGRYVRPLLVGFVQDTH